MAIVHIILIIILEKDRFSTFVHPRSSLIEEIFQSI